MKWNNAIEQIEAALKANVDIYVEYHKSWKRNDNRIAKVDRIVSYPWKNGVCKGIVLGHDYIHEVGWIIDDVRKEGWNND